MYRNHYNMLIMCSITVLILISVENSWAYFFFFLEYFKKFKIYIYFFYLIIEIQFVSIGYVTEMSLLFTVAFDQMKASLLNKSIHIFKIRSYWFQTFQWCCTLNLSKQNFTTWPESMHNCTSLLAYFLNVVQISLLLNLCKIWMWYFK